MDRDYRLQPVEQVLKWANDARLAYIVKYTKEHGYCPTVREISWQGGSPNTTVGRNHLKLLRNKGYIELVPKCARAIKVLKQP